MKRSIIFLLGVLFVSTVAYQASGASAEEATATQAQAPRTTKFRTCNGVDGTFQVPASQRCPLSGYANVDHPSIKDNSKKAKATQAPPSWTRKFRSCNGIDGTFQVPASQKCPLSGYANVDQPTIKDNSKKARTTQAPPSWTRKFRTCKGIDGTFQVPVSQKCPLSGWANH